VERVLVYQSFDEVQSAAAQVDDTTEDVSVAFILQLFEDGVYGDVDTSASAAVAAWLHNNNNNYYYYNYYYNYYYYYYSVIR